MSRFSRYILTIGLLLITSIKLYSAPINISLGGNAYVTNDRDGAEITNKGLTMWKNPSSVISSWFKVDKPGTINLSLRVKSLSNKSLVRITVMDENHDITLTNKDWNVIPVADNVTIDEAGYIRIDIQGISKEGDFFAEVSDWIIDGSVLSEPVYYVHNFSDYWGRRGPSVHLGYDLPKDNDYEYFYNEVTVPEGEDVIGSYFMANGFAEGYFGMQVNAEKERRILFSVWSPFTTDHPEEIPLEDRIINLHKGKDVHIGEFGNEGSGGQSYLKYMWKAGNTYKFLTQIHPDKKGNTIYTGYFFAPEIGEWQLIASFKRPKTNTWYQHPHSFLENFIPDQGYLERNVKFGNQWAVTKTGKWVELTQCIFTYDATARAQVRMDYAGGYNENSNTFYLKNCGFFNENTLFRSTFDRQKENQKPVINLKKLNSLQINQ